MMTPEDKLPARRQPEALPAQPIRVALVQDMLAHYRSALFRALDTSDRLEITFFTRGQDVEGIAHLTNGYLKRIHIAPVHNWRGLYWQSSTAGLGISHRYDAVLLMGNPHYVSAWIAAASAKLRGVPILMWTHGWLRTETGFKRLLRSSFYRLADRLLVYNERSRELGIADGYPAERISVVYNSLDLEKAQGIIQRIETGDLSHIRPSAMFETPDRPLIICTARLTSNCRFDLLLEAASVLEERGLPLNILLVGDGPMRSALNEMAKGLKSNVHFAGAVYDDEVLGPWLYHADITVSPGKVGLTAIHSMMYGTPVITHGAFDHQMPEVEAVVEGTTGAFFPHDNVEALAECILSWLSSKLDRHAVREACRKVVEDKWNPTHQAKQFELAIAEVAGPTGGISSQEDIPC